MTLTIPKCHYLHYNVTWIGVGQNLGLRGERPGTDSPSHGMAQQMMQEVMIQ
jgi:hypothetical protein